MHNTTWCPPPLSYLQLRPRQVADALSGSDGLVGIQAAVGAQERGVVYGRRPALCVGPVVQPLRGDPAALVLGALNRQVVHDGANLLLLLNHLQGR